MSAVYELNELEIDEISLVDRGANEGAEVTLVKRHEPDDIAKRLQVAEEELVLKHVEGLEKRQRSAVLKFLSAANAALAERLVEKGMTQAGSDISDDETTLQQWAQDFAQENGISVPVAKARLVSENKEAAALFKRARARQAKRTNI